jgi:small subunit ribosomal protein S11e
VKICFCFHLVLFSSPFLSFQRENAFQKQPTIFVGKRRPGVSKRKGRNAIRYYKSVGLGFKTPKEAIEGNYIDKKCPFTGNVSIRGRIIRGMVLSTKMQRTIVVRRDYLHYIPKYNRFEKRHKNIPAHVSPCFTVNQGDIVTLGQCRSIIFELVSLF